MPWTTATPSFAGVYWHLDSSEMVVCEIVMDEESQTALALLTGDDQLYNAVEFTGLWLGPIDPPAPPAESWLTHNGV